MANYTHGSLFTGIGVFDLAAKNNGFENVFGCDKDPFSALHFQTHNAKSTWFGDITKLEKIPTVNVLTFGFPCQDASIASPVKNHKPLNHARTGLFWEAIRLIQAAKPEWVIAENVARLRNKGLEECLHAFATSGYHVGYAIIPASTFGALHDRERLFIIANASSLGREKVLQVLKEVLTKSENRQFVVAESDSVLRDALGQETEHLDNGKDYGTAYWLHQGLRAKAIGNAVYYPIAETLMRCIKSQLVQE